jgi:glycosyltransferase involved in cell wall biosynthesis
MILSDNPNGSTGLGRVARELACRIHEELEDVFEVCTLGVGGKTSSSLPFAQYLLPQLDNYAIPNLSDFWDDFAGDESGIIFTIWNASWLEWFVNPSILAPSRLKKFLNSGRIERWGYLPIDAEGPNRLLQNSQFEILSQFDRRLAYTRWAADMIDRTATAHGMEWFTPNLPHGTELVFLPQDRNKCRGGLLQMLGIKDDIKLDERILLMGVVATNTARKDWPLAFETCAELVRRGESAGIIAHTNSQNGFWDLASLADDFGLRGRVLFSTAQINDESMAKILSACDVVLSIGAGEGWGLVGSEALACGVPVVHGNYAGSTEFIPQNMLVEPAGWRYQGFHGCKRPVFRAIDWADKVLELRGTECHLEIQYRWEFCWEQWKQWLKDGVK